VAPSARTAWHAVLIERASGQLVLALCALLTLPLVPPLRERVLGGWGHGASAWAAITGLLLMIFLRRAKRPDSALRRFLDDASRALLASAAWPRQLLVSFALLCSYVAVYLCCARALGVAAPTPLLAALICWVLLAMALPLSLAGWGIREGAAASVWLLAGLPVAEGVAVSILYGLVVFVSTLPGAWFLWRAARAESPPPVQSGGGE
jgi:uncharacterized membrane protein YbhN (UPF0104 family)